jgi:hypothetical protein
MISDASALIALAAFIAMIIVGKYLFGPLVHNNTLAVYRGGSKQKWVIPLIFILFCFFTFKSIVNVL